MKMLNTKLVLSALGIVAMLTSPAFAKSNRSEQQTTQFQAPMEQYPTGNTRTGTASNQFEQGHGYYPAGSGNS
jgi:hypothetical protein